MRAMSAAEAKQGFGNLIDLARQAPVTIEKHGRPVVVVVSIEEFERLVRQAGLEHRAESKKREGTGE